MATATPKSLADALPGHLELPDHDDSIVNNFREHPQSLLLTDSILPILRAKHSDGRFAIGQDCGIYWKLVDPPQRGAVCPDWFYVPDVPSDLDGHYRRSYVLWKEPTRPSIVLEFASGDGSEERDQTPGSGKFWIYERIVTPEYYGIFNVESGDLEFFHLIDGRYQSVAPNARGHFPFPPLRVELGVWHGYFLNEDAPWMRWFDEQGVLIPTFEERLPEVQRRADEEQRRADEEQRRADEEQRRADEEQRRADEEQRRADEEQRRALAAEAARDLQERRAEALAAKLRALGVDPDEV